MGIKLRKQINNNNTTSLYFDIYHNGKRKYEFLQHLKLQTKPANPAERKKNSDNLALANKILAKRQQDLESSNYDVIPKFKQDVDFKEFFFDFLGKYKKKDKRVIQACYNQFETFLKESEIKTISARHLDANIVYEFKNFLSEKLNGESPANYFKKFKLVINDAIRKNILLKNPAERISIKSTGGIKKQILTPAEIQLLAETPVTNKELKRASIFSLYTGLRFSDIQNLKWQNIDLNNKVLNLSQQKTNEQVTLNLHPTALKALGEPKKPKENVFKLPSHTACTKGIKQWVKKAKINKKISFHCFRHSFATNIIFFGADVNTASKLLGHTSFRYTERYTHIVKSLKDKAISNLPEVELI